MQIFCKILTFLVLASVLTQGFSANALMPFSQSLQLNQKQNKSQVVLVAPLDGSPNSLDPSGFSLLSQGRIGLLDFGRSVVRNLGLSNLIDIRTVGSNKRLGLVDSRDSVSIELSHQGVPLCFPRLKMMKSLNQRISLLGQLPAVESGDQFDHSWPDESIALELAQDWGAQNDSNVGENIRRFRRCYLVLSGVLVPAARATVYVDGLPYRITTTERAIEEFTPAFFNATGVVKSFSDNPVNGTINFSVYGNMVGDGSLHSTTFKTDVAGAESAVNCEQKFNYATDDIRFQEANVFAAAQATLNYFHTQFGYSWASQYERGALSTKTDKMVLEMHQTFGSTTNNALYQPAEDDAVGGVPKIRIGDGDGVGLQNLALDSDVVSHEFGHHIVYRSVSEYQAGSESLILHEALADFFTFSRTGNACLGESICPAGSRFCYQPSCLRTAENDIKWTDPDKPSLDHLEGQIISGMLWDIYKAGKIALNDLATIVYFAVDILSESSTFTEFFVALITVDSSRYGGLYCQDLVDSMRARGFVKETWSDVFDCGTALRGASGGEATSSLYLLEEDTEGQAEQVDYIVSETTDEAAAAQLGGTVDCPQAPTVASDLTSLPCGVVGKADTPSGSGPWPLAILLTIPLSIALTRRKVRGS